MTLKEFVKTRIFIVNVLAVIGISISLVLFIIVFLKVYTDHGESIAIPNLNGKTINEVANIVSLNDLRYDIQDSVFLPQTPPGTVVEQFPKPGMRVKKNRTIFLTICARSQEMIAMPQLTDISHRQATNLIESSGLVAGNIEYKQSEFPNLVLEQKINGRMVQRGELVPKGSIVDLVLGRDSDGTTSQVPTLFGSTLSDTRLTLEAIFLNIGTVSYDESFTSEEQKTQGLVWKQSPDPSEVFEVETGTSIDIWLTIDPNKLQEKPKTQEPDNSFF